MIKVTEEYYIKAEDNQYTLIERKIGKAGKNEGKELFTNVGYYYTLTQALNGCMRLIQMDTLGQGDIDLKQAILELDRVHKKFENTLKEIVESREKLKG